MKRLMLLLAIVLLLAVVFTVGCITVEDSGSTGGGTSGGELPEGFPEPPALPGTTGAVVAAS